jgi:hypothetical protein
MSYVATDAAPHWRGAADPLLATTETASLVSTLLNRSYDGTVKPRPSKAARMGQCVESFRQERRRARYGDGPTAALAHTSDGPTAQSAATSWEGPNAYGC